jgi:hypothetical protein
MNRNRWQQPDIPLPTLALKLGEEAGEVGNVLTDADPFMLGEHNISSGAFRHMVEELDQVVFIASVMQSRVQAILAKRER